MNTNMNDVYRKICDLINKYYGKSNLNIFDKETLKELILIKNVLNDLYLVRPVNHESNRMYNEKYILKYELGDEKYYKLRKDYEDILKYEDEKSKKKIEREQLSAIVSIARLVKKYLNISGISDNEKSVLNKNINEASDDFKSINRTVNILELNWSDLIVRSPNRLMDKDLAFYIKTPKPLSANIHILNDILTQLHEYNNARILIDKHCAMLEIFGVPFYLSKESLEKLEKFITYREKLLKEKGNYDKLDFSIVNGYDNYVFVKDPNFDVIHSKFFTMNFDSVVLNFAIRRYDDLERRFSNKCYTINQYVGIGS